MITQFYVVGGIFEVSFHQLVVPPIALAPVDVLRPVPHRPGLANHALRMDSVYQSLVLALDPGEVTLGIQNIRCNQ